MRKIKNLYYYGLILWLSIKSITRLNLGDDVIYKGKKYTLTQGVMNPKWNLSGDEEYLENIHRENFKKVFNLHACYRSFKHSYNFYMQNWYGTWCRGGIKDWMRGCNIWQKDRK